MLPLINNGHIHFGENKVQEAFQKWTDIKQKNTDLKIHMVGKLQTNKVKKAVLFLIIYTRLDSQKLADNLKKVKKKFKKNYLILFKLILEMKNKNLDIAVKDVLFTDIAKNEKI